MMDEKKITINTQGGPVINGGTFSHVEFVANKYVYYTEPKHEKEYLDIEDVEEVIENTPPFNPQKFPNEPSLLLCIEKLMDEKNEKGKFLVSQGNHWMAIFRIIVDKELGASNTDYLGFCNMIDAMNPDGFRIPLKQDNLKAISKTIYHKAFDDWKYDPAYNPTRKPYDDMVAVATRFKKILEENGF